MDSSKPLLIYDGQCGFCKIWIDYGRKLTGDRVEYAPSQEVGERYPQISKQEFSRAFQCGWGRMGRLLAGSENWSALRTHGAR